MWAYIFRRVAYNIPVYLLIILLLMLALRVHDPVGAYLGKHATPEQIEAQRAQMGLDRPFLAQYTSFLGQVLTLDFTEKSWDRDGRQVGDLLATAAIPSLVLTIPALFLSALFSICIGLVSSFYRGRMLDRVLVIAAVLGMSISFLVYIVFGQYWGAFLLGNGEIFAINGYELNHPDRTILGNWVHYCLLPVMISVIVTMGYDTRYYRAVMVEECSKDYIITALAKGASKKKIMFVHMLKNAMIPIITRVMITIPFLITGSFLLESYFSIPGMGLTLLNAISAKDFPVIQAFTAVFAVVFIATNILTDVLYALVDPRVRLS